MHSVKGKRLRRVAIGIDDIIVTSLVVDISDALICPLHQAPAQNAQPWVSEPNWRPMFVKSSDCGLPCEVISISHFRMIEVVLPKHSSLGLALACATWRTTVRSSYF